jgi:hypothetical protein
MALTKQQVKASLGLETDAALGRVFGIGRWAVGQWGEDEAIPELRELQLRRDRPDLFDADGNLIDPIPEPKAA